MNIRDDWALCKRLESCQLMTGNQWKGGSIGEDKGEWTWDMRMNGELKTVSTLSHQHVMMSIIIL